MVGAHVEKPINLSQGFDLVFWEGGVGSEGMSLLYQEFVMRLHQNSLFWRKKQEKMTEFELESGNI